ncbi:MAG: UDP-2,3-diacylglucosamine diphosphatase, partial [Thiothrix sp.]
KLYFQHGNRDFLIGEQFAAAIGCTLLPESTVIDLYGAPTLLLHGDTLCTDDVDYQQIRKELRHPQWQQVFLALPLEERIRQAQAMRAQSQAKQQVRDYLVDVNQQTVQAVLQAAGVRYLIHGHTHRPAIHEWQTDGVFYQRIVLGDWHAASASFLRVDVNSVELSY